MKRAIVAKKGLQAIGPYSQGIVIDNLVFVAGNIGIDPETGSFVKGGIKEQTKQTLKNIEETLKAEKLTLDNVLKTTVYLKDFNDFPVMNEVYATFFKKPYPARATVEVVRLPKDALIEIECIASFTNSNECCADCTCC